MAAGPEMAADSDLFSKLQEKIGYPFKDDSLLRAALRHGSGETDGRRENQRLEFLGDSVLSLCITDALFNLFPDKHEGDLTRYRSFLTDTDFLAKLAAEIGLDKVLMVGPSFTSPKPTDKMLEDALEAVIGAVFRNGGFTAAEVCVRKLYGDLAERLKSYEKDPKTALKELLDKHPSVLTLEWITIEPTAAHPWKVTGKVSRMDKSPACEESGEGGKRKHAEKEAARKLLEPVKVLLGIIGAAGTGTAS